MKTFLLLLIPVLMATFSTSVKKTAPSVLVISKGHLPNMATDQAGNIHLVFGSGDSILYATSSDQAHSFSSPQLVATLPGVYANAMRGPQVALTSAGIIIIANTKEGNIFSYHKTASGNWSQAVKVNDVDTVSKEALISLGGDGNNAFAVWLDTRGNGGKGQELFGAHSQDGGITWSKNILVYASPEKTICECCKPSVLVKGNQVYAMFRNLVDGSRDLYLVGSSDLGQHFGKASKLGLGSWKLSGCPMDGGGMAIGESGRVETVWRREGNIYASTPGLPETLIGQGRSCTIETAGGKNIYSWTTNGDVMVLAPDRQIRMLGKGSVPVIKKLSNNKVICAWENDDQVHASIVEW